MIHWGYSFDPKKTTHWWFGNCRPNERLLCWHYELLRDCPHAVESVLKWREENPIESFEGKPSGSALDYFRANPVERIIDEWPETPWLEIPQETRAWYLEVHNTVAEWSWAGSEEWLKKQRSPLATFIVSDWGKSFNQLNNEFAEWQKRERPKGEPIRERRGHPKLGRQVESWLKALGAWRLWWHAGLSHNEILSHFVEHLEEHQALPYTSQSQLSKVICKTAAGLEQIDQSYRR
jgi:hypothetical protein